MKSKKAEIYKKERNEILGQLKQILNLDEINNRIYINDIDYNAEKKIMELKDKVWLYFYGKNTTLFQKKQTYVKKSKEYMSLIKLVFKEMGYDMYRIEKKNKIDKKYVYNTYYLLFEIDN